MSPQSQTIQPPKKRYTTPKLVRYGDVRSLIQSGPTGSAENHAQSGSAFMTTSDRVAKENIVRIGEHPLGIGLYLFEYKPEYRALCANRRQFGVMADEVEAIMPQAVSVHPAGHKMVDYAMLGIYPSFRS